MLTWKRKRTSTQLTPRILSPIEIVFKFPKKNVRYPIKLLSALFVVPDKPNKLFSWETTTVIAAPAVNPIVTGSAINDTIAPKDKKYGFHYY